MKAVIGLGNPGERYARTRHNLGRMAVRAFLERLPPLSPHEHDFSVVYRTDQTLIVEPLVYMNLSGVAVGEICQRYALPPHDLLIVYDDYSLPFGRLRAKAKGGAGGHHGMESIIEALQTEEIPRLRLGIGSEQPLRELSDYVLAPFSEEEAQHLPEFLARAAAAIECFVQHGIEAVMNRFNVR
ncbi:MAG: aminoacyl-tRNA hydrolase [Candidatus Bipolaricaulota bacterium]|nr:aminoacyl-tRNA hydrolase [Candidatus Bipolaricaulota bacterium]MCS7274822.1 aminoacyl-tRNA hydrolase [Candidatus Bipolaricaulota bacterium]MDW8111243.1 aminoacyl-tRNA hydrolase [Candidatus Bipolaricaulota bacterium]MDW8328621.1 aminoacyl-tRNA hydrolase [Candidatus Bipolaricaulota bacterium]